MIAFFHNCDFLLLESLFSGRDGPEGLVPVASCVVRDFCVFSEGY